MEKSCKKCLHFHFLLKEGVVGECHLHAPTITSSGKTMYPIVNVDLYCGDFSSRDFVAEQKTSKRHLLKG